MRVPGGRKRAVPLLETRLQHYRARLSGPLLDRFDIHIEIPRIPVTDLVQPLNRGESAAYARRLESLGNASYGAAAYSTRG